MNLLWLSLFLGGVCLLLPVARELLSIRKQDTDAYSVHILNYDPLMIYLEDFIAPHEREHLLQVGSTRFRNSTTFNTDGKLVQSSYRTSSTASLANDDVIVDIIKTRVSDLHGFVPRGRQETFQLTQYFAGQEFKPHVDFLHSSGPHDLRSDRITTIFAVLEATCDNCGTHFSNLTIDWSKRDDKWCRFVECDNTTGVIFRAIPGNAIFWRNVDNLLLGDRRTLHAGLPPEKGVKVGLNIWTHG